MIKKNILVTGADGQLGNEIKALRKLYSEFNIDFKNKNQLDITNKKAVNQILSQKKYDFCINTAAYTQVDQAEKNPEKALAINTWAVSHLAEICQEKQTTLIHISTDYVFDGEKKNPYNETDATHPLNIYGQSKLNGEKEIQKKTSNYFIIRTSWLYNPYFGNNFYRKILELTKKQDVLKVIDDQTGTPTLTKDLASFIFFLIKNQAKEYGIYHFSNTGQTSWYQFAKKILEIHQLKNKIVPVKTSEFKTLAKRPQFSVLSKNKIKKIFNFTPENWQTALLREIKR